MDVPTGNIPLAEARKVMRHPYIESSIPLAYGDNYELFRIVGTEASHPEHYGAEVTEGRLFEAPFEVTVGAEPLPPRARIGDTFHSAHGLKDGTDVHRDKVYTVVGVFGATGSIIDQLLLTSIESVWGVHADIEGADQRSRPSC